MPTPARTSASGSFNIVDVSAARSSALRLALAFALVKLTIQVGGNLWQAHIGWGYFRDEFYYLACGRHLAWGYVDHGPLVAVQARLAEAIFGHSLAGLRLFAALAGAARVFLTGWLAFALGGKRSAQSLAMLGILVVPQYFGTDGYLSMNSFESMFWMTCILCLLWQQERSRAAALNDLSLAERPQRHLLSWAIFGVSAGLGLLNKPSMTFFLVALGAALLVTGTGRALLLRREALVGVALLLLLASPNLIWQIGDHWPTLEFLHNGRAEGKNISLSPPAFLLAQVMALHPLTIFLWVPGLVWLLVRPGWRWLGLTYVFFLALMMALHAKDYYVTPIYPLLFAAGGIAWEQYRGRLFRRHNVPAEEEARSSRILGFPIYQATLALTGLLILPMAIPVFTPETWLRYAHALHLYGRSGNTEASSSGVLPQFYADRFGWQEEVDEVTRIYRGLSPADQKRAVIFGSNYGEAGAVDFLGRGLPRAISSHNNYFLWGPGNASGEVVILISGDTPEHLHEFYNSVEIVGRMETPFSMPFEHRNIYLLRRRKVDLRTAWPEFKHYI